MFKRTNMRRWKVECSVSREIDANQSPKPTDMVLGAALEEVCFAPMANPFKIFGAYLEPELVIEI